MIRLDQILVFAAQADPTEGSVTIVEQLGAHDVLHVAGPDETIFFVHPITRNLLHAGIVDGLHEGVSVIEEVGAASHELTDHFEMSAQRLIDELPEGFRLFAQHACAFLEADANGAVAALVNGMAGGLVGEQLDEDAFALGILEQVDHIAVIGDRAGLPPIHRLAGHTEGFGDALGHVPHPTLTVACLDTRGIHLGDDRCSAGYLSCLGLCAAHTAEAGGDEEMAAQVAVLWHTELHTACVEERVERAVHDALRPDVHPSAGCHLSVVGHAHLHGDVPVVQVVKLPNHHGVGDDHARCFGVRAKEAERVARLDDERLILGQLF